jgi:hypothetical protein
VAGHVVVVGCGLLRLGDAGERKGERRQSGAKESTTGCHEDVLQKG